MPGAYGVPTAHGGKAWWPHTVRKVVLLAESSTPQ